jgi:hypothetical protein
MASIARNTALHTCLRIASAPWSSGTAPYSQSLSEAAPGVSQSITTQREWSLILGQVFYPEHVFGA